MKKTIDEFKPVASAPLVPEKPFRRATVHRGARTRLSTAVDFVRRGGNSIEDALGTLPDSPQRDRLRDLMDQCAAIETELSQIIQEAYKEEDAG